MHSHQKFKFKKIQVTIFSKTKQKTEKNEN